MRQHGKSRAAKEMADAAVENGYRVVVASRTKLQLLYKREDGSIAVEDYEPESPSVWLDEYLRHYE